METQTKDKKKSNIGRGQVGSVKIADDVVGMIAALAALEVDGVSSMAGGVKSGVVGRISRARLGRCARALLNQSQVRVDLSVVMQYGYNIPATCGKVQARVKSAIENMTGLTVTGVNVRIAEISMPTPSGQD
ncbi:MAG: Asp23/Gls24 family envelope stress response protein [Lachnospiraceae bacterium]|nr:Asp23/Gls24 family envelope stress response protein [Lachnospiraceae bacterium]